MTIKSHESYLKAFTSKRRHIIRHFCRAGRATKNSLCWTKIPDALAYICLSMRRMPLNISKPCSTELCCIGASWVAFNLSALFLPASTACVAYFLFWLFTLSFTQSHISDIRCSRAKVLHSSSRSLHQESCSILVITLSLHHHHWPYNA